MKQILNSVLKKMPVWESLVFVRSIVLLLSTSFVMLASESDTVRLTLNQGTNIAIDLSPDKKQIVMDLQGTIWTLPVSGGKAIAITDALGDCRIPVWSPDNSRIAFHSYRDGNYHIWTVNKDGTKLKQLTFGMYDDREPVWSPDGKSIAFSSDRSGNYAIWQLDLSSGRLKQISRGEANEYFPSYSADGTKIIFVSEKEDAAGIYAVSLDGKEELLFKDDAKLAGPTWDSKGSQVVYNAILEGRSVLQMATLSNKNVAILSRDEEDVFPFRISWLSETEMLYAADGEIKKKNIKDKKTETVPFTAELSLGRHVYNRKKYDFNTTQNQSVKGIRNPVVSPDGKRVVFTALGDLWMLTKGNKKPEKVTDDPFLEIDPIWSPDGEMLAYLSDRNGNMDLYIKDLSSQEEKCLVDGPDALRLPSWSADGSKIAFYQADGRLFGSRPINVVDVGSGQITTVHDGLFDGSRPSWSHNNTQLILSALRPNSTRYREGVSEFLLVSLNGDPDKSLSPVLGRTLATRGINGPVYSPDGNNIAYILDGLLWIVPIDQDGNLLGPPKRLVNELAEAPSWTGDSKSIVYLATDVLKQVFLADGHTETIPMDFAWKYKKPNENYVIHAGKVFDGKSEKYLTNVDILVEGNRIADITPHDAGRKGKRIDASDKTVIPGLFEMHTHQDAGVGEKLGRLWLSYGITSTREPGTDPYDVIERKEAWASGRRKGPRAFYTGGLMDGGRIYYGMAVGTSAAQLELELDRAERLGYDMIKTYVRMPDLMQKRITEFAHKIGIPVSSHEIYPATKYGVDNVEHMGATSRRGYSPKLTALNNSYQDVIEIITKSGMIITPTASLHGGYFSQIDKDPHFFDHWQFNAFYSEKLIAETRETLNARIKSNAAYLTTFPSVQKSVKAIFSGGGKVTPGTDSPIIPMGISLHAELQCWVDAGISPFEALRSATLWSAEAIGVGDQLGSIEVGKLADMLILDGDPLLNIKDILNIESVIRNGELFSQEDLKAP